MIEKARVNAEKIGFHNVEFRQGDIEQYAGYSKYRRCNREQLCIKPGTQQTQQLSRKYSGY